MCSVDEPNCIELFCCVRGQDDVNKSDILWRVHFGRRDWIEHGLSV